MQIDHQLGEKEVRVADSAGGLQGDPRKTYDTSTPLRSALSGGCHETWMEEWFATTGRTFLGGPAGLSCKLDVLAEASVAPGRSCDSRVVT